MSYRYEVWEGWEGHGGPRNIGMSSSEVYLAPRETGVSVHDMNMCTDTRDNEKWGSVRKSVNM